MRKYEFRVVVTENIEDEFWESIEGTGCDLVIKLLIEATNDAFGCNSEVELIKYQN